MLMAFHGDAQGRTDWTVDVPTAARNVYDDAYRGTGNWAFNAAYAGGLGLCAFIAYLRDLDHARRFIAAGLPLALSYAWERDELPGAPIERSDGHLAVLRGFAAGGDPIVNDPARREVRAVYSRPALERVWQRHGGVVYVVAPPQRADEALRLANA
jgi:hypothetical protein